MQDLQHYGDNFIFVVPEAHPLHTSEHPFCYNDTCDCHEDQELVSEVNTLSAAVMRFLDTSHEDQELVSEVNTAVTNGLLTPDEATALIAGRTI